MNSSIHESISKRVRANHNVWSDIIATTYVICLKDQIGSFGAIERDGVPGLWGHSYVRTYNKWVGLPVSDRKKMEGGIATSYFVLHSLNDFSRLCNKSLPSSIEADVSKFLESRTTSTGTGIQTTTPRGTTRIDTNLRHTCFAYLMLRELSPLLQTSDYLTKVGSTLRSCILEARSEERLLQEWSDDSWPPGAIASYIAARDKIFEESEARSVSVPRELRFWQGVRARLMDAFTDLTSSRMAAVSRKHAEEHFPYWHPIAGLPVLRLHSTLGCLNLIGRSLGQGHRRVNQIVYEIRDHVAKCEGVPRFDRESPPSIAAATAMLVIILGPWHEPSSDDLPVLDKLMSFIEQQWGNPDVYEDYWAEFSVPLLNITDIWRGLKVPSAVLCRANDLLGLLSGHEKPSVRDSGITKIIEDVLPRALGN